MQTPIELLAKDLNGHGGVFCPSPLADMKLWNSHPKVFWMWRVPATPNVLIAAPSTASKRASISLPINWDLTPINL